MEWTALTFYAVVCGALSTVSPALTSPLVRLVSGAAVGVVAATVLPVLQGIIAY